MQLARQLPAAEIVVPDAFLESVLAPYKPRCRYLKRALVSCGPEQSNDVRSGSQSRARGEFEISESCYIADTGHFNAVEFNICYNQLTYTLLAASIERKWIGSMSGWSLDEYRSRQLSDFLIVEFTSEFRSPMRSNWFEGSVSIDKVTVRRGTIFMKTVSQFQDGQGGLSRGRALIAIVNKPSSKAAPEVSP